MMIYLTLNLETWHKIFLNNFSCAKWRHLKTIFVFLGCELKNVYNLAHYRKLNECSGSGGGTNGINLT